MPEQALRQFDVRALASLELEHEAAGSGDAEVVVAVPLFNYSPVIVECLQSVVDQELAPLSLVVIDDASTDDGPARAQKFLDQHRSRFRRARLIRHKRNQGLAMARTSGVAWSGEPFIFFLDADNRLRPPALSRLVAALHVSRAEFAYSQLRLFGSTDAIGVADIWDVRRLHDANYIDAMSLVRRDALLAAGGFVDSSVEVGWEDYDLWCRFAKRGFRGVFLPELLCEYRVHNSSMLRKHTNFKHSALMAEIALRHPELAAAMAEPTDGQQ